MGKLYSIDTSSLIHSWHAAYPPRIFRTLWEHLESMIDDGRLFASDEVLRELKAQDDELLSWAKQRPSFFIAIDGAVTGAVTKVLSGHAALVNIKAGKSSADPFVIAVAMVRNACVVTQETAAGPGGRVRIPNVCQAHHVVCTNMLGLIADEGLRF